MTLICRALINLPRTKNCQITLNLLIKLITEKFNQSKTNHSIKFLLSQLDKVLSNRMKVWKGIINFTKKIIKLICQNHK